MKIDIKISLEVEGNETYERLKVFHIRPGVLPNDDMDMVLDQAMRLIDDSYKNLKSVI